jgi:hypothetical protein
MAKQVGKSKRVKEFNISSLDGGMDVASDPITMDTSKALLIQNMEFDSEGERLITRRGLGSPIHTFDSDVYYIWYDYELNLYLIFLKNKNVYTYEYGKDPKLIGVLNGDTTNYPQVTRYTNANGTYLLIASGKTMQVYEYSGTSINTDAKYPECNTVMERFSRILTSNSGSNNIKYSGVADPFNWTENSNDGSAMKDLDVGDVSSVEAIYPLAEELIIFKKNGNIYRVANEPEDWNVTLVGTSSDFITKDSMTNLQDDVVYFSRQGLRSLETSETYGNFTNKEIGEAMNPEMKSDTSAPWMVKCLRTHQLVINPNSGKNLYVYNYQMKAFTKWTFASPVNTLCEGMENTLVGIGKEIFNLSKDNHSDIVGGTTYPIHQKIVSKRLVDLNIMTLYRSYLMIESTDAGKATLTVNGVSWDWNWTKDRQREEFKTQLRSDDMTFTFETDNIITWHFWDAVVVQQYATMVSDSSSSGSSGNGSWSNTGKSKKKSSWGQGVWGDTTINSSGSPYG